MATEIPKPPGWPIIGNALELTKPESISQLATQYGPIFKVSHGTNKPDRVYVCSAELLNEICDEKRFAKNPTSGGLSQVRNLTGDGLFTALNGEENWALAHRILMPVLGPMSIGNMFEDMHEIASQLVLKWARLDKNTRIGVTEDFTRLTLDTLALCTMDTRFNSFYSETPHSFVVAMTSFLEESGLRALRPSLVTDYVYRKQTKKYYEDIDMMRDIAFQVIERRKSASIRKKDLVDAMIHEKDPGTGQSLPHENIINNMITFLIAGHETTSGLLSFLLFCLIKNPAAMTKAREEVLSVLGEGVMTPAMTSKLPYISAVIRETLRLYPTAPGFSVQPKSTNPEDYPLLLGPQKYGVRQGETIVASLSTVHRDRIVYGEDAEEFRPERMLDEQFNKLPKNSWKPFGNGARGCIGRTFALQESSIVIALLLQNFDFELADPDYHLSVQRTLTVKPKGLFIRATLRDNLTPATLQRRLLGGQATLAKRETLETVQKVARLESALQDPDLKNLVICYGSNTGTCQTLAHALSREARTHGFRAVTMPMDSAQDRITPSTPIIIITASYEGEPPDNAVQFVNWLERLTDSPFTGVSHAVYGCGNRDWVDTFQRIPTLVDDAFIRCGSSPLVKRGISDAADSNIFNEFDRWADVKLWPALEKQYRPSVSLQNEGIRDIGIDIIQSRRSAGMLPGGGQAVVQEERVLTATGEPQKRHIKIRLPEGMTYRAGDHLAILPANHHNTVRDVMNRFGLVHDTKMIVGNGDEHSVYTFLRDYVELNHVATEKNIRTILASVPQIDLGNASRETLIRQRETALRLLQKLPTAALSFAEYLSMLPPMRSRRYSISSSPLADVNTCTLIYSVLDYTITLPNGTKSSLYGAGSTYLASLRPNDRIFVSVRPSPPAFHLPEELSVPIVMVCAGSGLAPFLGFVQERSRLLSLDVPVNLAPALLLIGCRHPDRDALHVSSLRTLAASARVSIKYAFSRVPDQSQDCKYVQDLLWKERSSVMKDMGLIKGKGKMFVCGDSRVLEGIASVMKNAYKEVKGAECEADQWWETFRRKSDKYACEVFD